MTEPKVDKFRFGVFSGDRQASSLWVAVTNGNDLYIGARSIMDSLKVSIHGSGVCQVAFLKTYLQAIDQRNIVTPTGRAMVRWKRAPTPPRGAICVASVRFPTDWLSTDRQEQQKITKLVFPFKMAPAGHAVEVGFFYSIEPPSTLEAKLSKVGLPAMHSDLPNGEFMSVVARTISFEATIPPHLKSIPTNSLLRDDVLQNVGDQMRGLSGVLYSDVRDGQPLIMTQVNNLSLRR